MNSALQQAADVFDETLSTPAEIESAGEKAMVVIYNGKMDDTLNSIQLWKGDRKLQQSWTKKPSPH